MNRERDEAEKPNDFKNLWHFPSVRIEVTAGRLWRREKFSKSRWLVCHALKGQDIAVSLEKTRLELWVRRIQQIDLP